MKSLLFVLVLFISNGLIGQSLNEYKYVIIPSKYDFQKSEDQYQLNSLTKFLFEKEGFETVYANLELPAEISNNPCSALTAKVNNESNMFTTKLVIELVNCKNQKVLVTDEGKSKEKEYKKGYQEALREAFEDVIAQNYSFSKSNMLRPAEEQVVEEEPEVIEIIETSEDETTDEIGITEMVEVEETIETEETNINNKAEPELTILYAQANKLGYQLVDSSPKVVFILLTSSIKNVYILKNKNGMVYKQNGTWVAEYFNGTELVKESLNIKF
ncbi:hypothetical protein [Aureibaculum sp. 2210JD6-5]|uniref:hypothetical protein n=1 Tax=Aureibaculum sp. 2210JD6-5 TaxID=3103957 RepID=UPI002ABE2191|nr:hypothetical protein [Aureibaculum sp. 2210JD6-5]